ncbi:MAG: hypothetical protein H7Y31_18680 [Chitinophagaceae bacterium]|nr:hypothetical protein [Chitinophagaceae bacterium]
MKIIFLLAFLMSAAISQSQSDSLFGPRKWVNGEFTDFTVDNLNNIYLFSPSGQLKKLNADGDSVAVFNDVRRYGKIYSIDVSNPLKVLLYFKDFGTVVVLDRFLSRRNVLDLRKLGLFQVKAIGQSYDNGFWVFDEQEGKLKRLSDAGLLVDQFTDFRVLFDSMPSPQIIVDQSKNLYLYDSARGVFVFDYYGAFRKRLPFIGWKDFAVINNFLFGRSDTQLFRYDPQTLQLRQFAIDKSMNDATKIQITPDNLYILRVDRLEIFPFKR